MPSILKSSVLNKKMVEWSTFGRDMKVEYEPSMFDEVDRDLKLVPMALPDAVVSRVFSFFNGSDMVYVISRLSKKYRAGDPSHRG